MKTQKIFNQADRDYIVDLLIADKWQEANTIAQYLGFPEGVNAELFENIIAKDGLNMKVIKAISVYYKKEVQ